MFLPTYCPPKAGIAEQNVKVPAVCRGWEPLLEMTGTYYIASDNTRILFCVLNIIVEEC